MLGDNFRAEECLKASSAKLSEAKTKLLTNTNYWQIGVCVYCVCNYLHISTQNIHAFMNIATLVIYMYIDGCVCSISTDRETTDEFA